MKFAMRWLVAGALVGVCVLAWDWTAGRDVVGAQGTSKPTVMKRTYTGTDGLSHVEDIVMDAKTVMENVTAVEVRTSPPGRFSDWHVGPERRYIINLAGTGQLEVAEGKVDLPPGSIEYIDDLTGKGHTTRVTSKEERVSIWLKFEDQKQRIGPLNPTAPRMTTSAVVGAITAGIAGKPVVMKRIYTGTDGLSHVEDIVMDANTLMEKVVSVEVRTSMPPRFSDWHPGPQRQYIINLAGTAQLEVAEGKVDLPPGSIEFIDDLTGKGHTTRGTGTQERVSLWLKFEDQKQVIGPLPKTKTTTKP